MLTWFRTGTSQELVRSLVLAVERDRVRCFPIDTFKSFWIDDYIILAWTTQPDVAFCIIRDGNVIYKGLSWGGE